MGAQDEKEVETCVYLSSHLVWNTEPSIVNADHNEGLATDFQS